MVPAAAGGGRAITTFIAAHFGWHAHDLARELGLEQRLGGNPKVKELGAFGTVGGFAFLATTATPTTSPTSTPTRFVSFGPWFANATFHVGFVLA